MIYSFSFNRVRKDFIYCEDETNEHPAFAPVSRNILSIPGVPGGRLINTVTQVRTIKQHVFFKGADKPDLRKIEEEIAAWLITDEPVELVFDDEPDRVYFAVVDGSLDINELVNVGEGTITFICPDPYKYGAETNISFVNNAASPNVGGTYKTFPRIEATFTAAATEFKVTHASSGKYVRVIKNFIVGDKLIIDFVKRKITLNGIVTMPILDWAKSDFFPLSVGTQTLNVTPTGKATVKIYWRPRWL
jgi:predicted phage tail component-like protein